jgi:hypothetical protein
LYLRVLEEINVPDIFPLLEAKCNAVETEDTKLLELSTLFIAAFEHESHEFKP